MLFQYFSWWQELEDFHAARLEEAEAGRPPSPQRPISFADACAQEAADSAPVQAAHLKGYKSIYGMALDTVRLNHKSRDDSIDDLAIWKDFHGKMGIIETYAREFLAVQPSQVASERIFSSTKAINLHRQSMTPVRMQRFVISTMNYKKLVTSAAQLLLEEERGRALDEEDAALLLEEADCFDVGSVHAPVNQPLTWQQL